MSRGSQLPLVVKPSLGQGMDGAGTDSKGRAGVWLLFSIFPIPDASRVAIEITQTPPPARIWGPRPAWPLLAAPRTLWMDSPLVLSQTNHRTAASLPSGNSALPCSLWRHFSALLRDVFKAPLFLFIGGSWKPFPGRAGALCAWDRGELCLSPAIRAQVLQNGRYQTCKLHYNVTETLDHV